MPFLPKYSKFMGKSMKKSDKKSKDPWQGMREALFEAPPLCYKCLPVQRKEIMANGRDRALSGDQLQSPKDQ
jgi:hypothetical protein